MIPSWKDPATQDLWTLTASEIALLPGMTDKGRLGFAVQLKFMQVHGRFPEHHDEIDPSVAQGLAAQLGTTADALSAYELNGRQGQQHQRTIRVFLGFRPTTGDDLQQLDQWLYREVLPVDPQARHGRDAALDGCRAHRLEPPRPPRPGHPVGGLPLRNPTTSDHSRATERRQPGRHRPVAGR